MAEYTLTIQSVVYDYLASMIIKGRAVFYSLSPFGTGDIKDACTLTISGGIATLSAAQTGNIGVGCDIDFDSPSINIYIAPNRLGFDSGGTTELEVDTKIEGGTSGATGIVRAIELTKGAWADGDAVGWIYFSTTSGTWQNNEQINRTKPTTSNNIATVNGTLQGNLGNGNTQFVVKTALGKQPADVSSAETVNSIHHEYASLSGYEANFTDGNHIDNTDLTKTGAAVVAYACCYYDHDDQTTDGATTIEFGTTGPSNYLQIFTPTGNSESINNQRHSGVWDGNKYIISTTNQECIAEYEEYARIEGLQFKIITSGTYDRILFCNLTTNDASLYISDNILIGVLSGSADYIYGIQCTYESSGDHQVRIFNNIVYDIINGAFTHIYGVIILNAWTGYCYNNTIHNCYSGIQRDGGTFIVKNNIVNDCTLDYTGTFDSSSTHNVTDTTGAEGAFGATHSTGTADGNTENHLIDSGATFQTDGVQVNSIVKNTTDTTYGYVTAVNSQTDLTLDSDVFPDGNEGYEVYTNMYGAVIFENEGADDFHLSAKDRVAKEKGTDLSSDANLPIWDDTEGDERWIWDVGADENRSLSLFDTVQSDFASVLTLPEILETLTVRSAVQSNLSGKPIPQLNLLLNPLNSVLDELGAIVDLQRDRIVDPKSAVHDQLANIVTILALKSLSIQSAIHEQLASVTDLTKESTLAIQNALHEQFATILTLTLPGIITLVIQNALHGELAKKANFSIAMLLRPQSALHEQKVLTEILQLLQKLTAQSAYHDFFSEITTLPGIVLVVKDAVHDALSGKLDIARGRLLDVDSAVQDLISDIPDLATAYQLIALDAVCSLIIGKPILTEEALIALYTYVAKNQIHIYTAKNQTHIYTAKNQTHQLVARNYG